MLNNKAENIFWKNINSIQLTLQLPNKAFSQLLQLTEEEFVVHKLNKSFFRMDRLDTFCQRLGMSINSLFEIDCDLLILRDNYFGKNYKIPEKYNYAKLSKSRTLTNQFDYLTALYGKETAYTLFSKLNIDPRFLDSPHGDINILAGKDMLILLREIGFNDEQLKDMGRRSYLTNKENDLGQVLSKHTHFIDLMDDFCLNQISKFEKNCHYNIIQSDSTRVLLVAKPTQECQELLKRKVINSADMGIIKSGVLETLPCYIGLRPMRAKMTKSMEYGDEFDQFEIKIS